MDQADTICQVSKLEDIIERVTNIMSYFVKDDVIVTGISMKHSYMTEG